MAVELSIESNFTLDSDLSQFDRDVQQWVTDGTQQVNQQVVPGMLDELRYQPGKPQYPLRWKSERQRRYVMAKLRREANLPYVRTGATAAAWHAKAQVIESSMVMTVGNDAPHSEFVYGSLNQRSRNEALSYQQPFHQETGWQLAVDTIAFWNDAALEIMDDAVVSGVSDFVQRTTRRRSKRL